MNLRMRARDIVIPLVVGLTVAFLQAIFSGPDLIRLIVYFFVGLGLAGVGLLAYRSVSGRRSRTSQNDLIRAGRMEADRRERNTAALPKADHVRSWADVKPEDLLAIDKMDNLTRNERNRLLEPYIGQWFTVEGVVDDVHGRPNDPTVHVYISERDHRVIADFKNDKARASSLRKGLPIRVIGSLHHAQGYIESIYLEDCEFGEIDRSVRPQPEPQTPAATAANEKSPVARPPMDKSVEVGAPFGAPVAEHGREFSGVGVGKTQPFRATKRFGFKWSPSAGIVIGALHGTLNGIPHSWTFDNNVNPYFPAKYAPPPDSSGNYHFSIDNITAGTEWTITVLYDDAQGDGS